MRTVTIDCASAGDPKQLHRIFSEALAFPAWYGNNLDALHDQLTALTEPTQLTLLHSGTLPRGFRRVLEDACIENSLLSVIF